MKVLSTSFSLKDAERQEVRHAAERFRATTPQLFTAVAAAYAYRMSGEQNWRYAFQSTAEWQKLLG